MVGSVFLGGDCNLKLAEPFADVFVCLKEGGFFPCFSAGVLVISSSGMGEFLQNPYWLVDWRM